MANRYGFPVFDIPGAPSVSPEERDAWERAQRVSGSPIGQALGAIPGPSFLPADASAVQGSPVGRFVQSLPVVSGIREQEALRADREAQLAAEVQRREAAATAEADGIEPNPYVQTGNVDGSAALSAQLAQAAEPISARQVGGMNRRGVDAQMGALRTGIQEQVAGAQQVAAAEQQAAKQKQAAYDAQVALLGQQARVERDAALSTASKMDAFHQRIEALTQQMGDPGQIDQNRLWNNMSTGGKILAGISMLFGAVGAAQTGVNSAVKVFQDAIKQDLDVQAKNVANRRDALRSQLEGYGRLADMVRQAGLDDRASRAAMLQIATNATVAQINAYAAQQGGAEAQGKAQMAAGALHAEAAKAIAGYEQEVAKAEYAAAQGNADRQFHADVANQRSQIAALQAMAKAQAKGKQDVTKLEQQPLRVLNDTRFAADAVDRLYVELKKLGPGAIDKFKNAIASTDSVAAAWQLFTGEVPEARKYSKSMDAWVRILGVALDSGSVLREAEVAEWKKIVGNASIGGEEGLQKLSALMVDKYNTSLKGFFQGQRNVHMFPFLARDSAGRVIELPLGSVPKGTFPAGTAEFIRSGNTPRMAPSGPQEPVEEEQ